MKLTVPVHIPSIYVVESSQALGTCGHLILSNDVLLHYKIQDVWLGRVGRIHGDIPPSKRIETSRKFTSGELRVLICTDLASRGLDIPDVSHVIQLDFASNAVQVLHRTGRTVGRRCWTRLAKRAGRNFRSSSFSSDRRRTNIPAG